MGHPKSSARLRTKTGCLDCRRSRKKCDEGRPACQRCTRLGLPCTWPNDYQLKDGRNRRVAIQQPHAAEPESQEVLTDPSQPQSEFDFNIINGSDSNNFSLQPMPILEPMIYFKNGEQEWIFNHFASKLLPSLMHRDSRPEYCDHSYMLNLAFGSETLMNAMIACAAMNLSTSIEYYRNVALKSYVATLSSMRGAINCGSAVGSEDYLLATTSLLCIFENSRTDTLPKIGAHVTALGLLLKLRSSPSTNKSALALAFEQTMAESFLYHGVLLMLFDHSFDPFHGPEHDLRLKRYFPEGRADIEYTTTSYEFHPVLGASYRFFLTIADITRLARRDTGAQEQSYWRKLDADLQVWESTEKSIQGSTSSRISLYAIAARALLTKAMPVFNQTIMDGCLELTFRQSLQTLQTLEVDAVHSTYHLWSLAILGSMATELESRVVFQQLFQDMNRKRRSGLGSWVQLRLRHIWNNMDSKQGILQSLRFEGLKMLVEEDSLDCTNVSV